jgi:hypothetical protein
VSIFFWHLKEVYESYFPIWWKVRDGKSGSYIYQYGTKLWEKKAKMEYSIMDTREKRRKRKYIVTDEGNLTQETYVTEKYLQCRKYRVRVTMEERF